MFEDQIQALQASCKTLNERCDNILHDTDANKATAAGEIGLMQSAIAGQQGQINALGARIAALEALTIGARLDDLQRRMSNAEAFNQATERWIAGHR